jgi:signal transduction histidine kinase
MARRIQRSESGRAILVVDDQEETLMSVRRLLEHERHRVFTASSGEEALELMRQHELHVLVVDYFMPHMTGGQLVERIRSFDPYVQIILQTGYSGEKPPRAMLAELDIQGYHDKADDPERLLLWIDVALRSHDLISGLRERERLQNELVANCSHEFRTPLNIISGYAELLSEGELGPVTNDAGSALRAIRRATDGLAELVGDFLSYARAEARVLAVHCQPVAIEELATELARLGTVLLEDKPVTFTVDLSAAPASVATDPVKVRTVLRNLVTNAVKFTASGTITFAVAADGERVRFSVRDTGIGISPADQEIVFEPFRQADGSMSRQYGGVGLGLALSRKLARLLGGDVVVESTLGVGSAFTLVLPIEAADTAQAGPTPGSTPWPATGVA